MVKPVTPVPDMTAPAERIVRIMPEVDATKIEKEISGLTAKLKWTHITEALKDVYRQRIEELKAQLSQ